MKTKRYILFILEYIIGSILFDIWIFKNIRCYIYGLFFDIEKNVVIYNDVKIAALHGDSNDVRIGKNTIIGHHCLLDSSGKLNIGDECVISQETIIYTHMHNIDTSHIENDITTTNIDIENNVWIGARTIVLPKVRKIGKFAVIGAGSIVTNDVNPYEILAGNPARVIGIRKV